MPTQRVKTLVIGAGISGLCAALALPEGALLLEAAETPGGWCRSIRARGFVWDCAGHYFHFRSQEAKGIFLSLFGPGELIEVEKRCRILYRGAQLDAPFQAHLAQLDKAELIDCLCELFDRPAPGDSFLAWLYGSFGAGITDKFLRPYNEKLYACPLHELDAGAMGRFFPAMTPEQILRSLRESPQDSYNARFFYPRQGAGALIEGLCRMLPEGSLRLGRRLVSVDAARREATDSAGQVYRYERLVNTAPLSAFLALLGSPGLAGPLRANRVLALNFGFAEPSPPGAPHWLYIPGQEAPFYRVGYYDALRGGGPASLCAELAYPEGAEPDLRRAQEDSLAALRRLGLIQPDNPLLAQSAVWMAPAYVHLQPGTEARVSAALAELEKLRIHSIGRYGGWRYCSMEDCMREAFALGERLREGGAA